MHPLDVTAAADEYLNRLLSLRAEIAGFTAVKCRMSHERIVRAADSSLPVASRFPQGSYKRIGLCDPEIRARELGCSHTMSRYRVDEAIQMLLACGMEEAGPAASLRAELNELTNNIHLLDHRKGEAETALARAIEEAHQSNSVCAANGRLTDAAEEIGRLEQLHDGYVERMSELRDGVLAILDKLIRQLHSVD